MVFLYVFANDSPRFRVVVVVVVVASFPITVHVVVVDDSKFWNAPFVEESSSLTRPLTVPLHVDTSAFLPWQQSCRVVVSVAGGGAASSSCCSLSSERSRVVFARILVHVVYRTSMR